ncbi:hypothetical protein OHA40_06220 [Nocardia sp. NBC_00508]|uniref:hypothetical protein n=1 Tax=Nocardia sp. NBC_00508 TaxID=2975992 RepID=UPI002E81502D|nr:hypothetical protein [Nocardia sp. NBC_00508]WUD67721.1 hypothetical protein OHA40_06220 [Nocardia sp. NBC_00508]
MNVIREGSEGLGDGAGGGVVFILCFILFCMAIGPFRAWSLTRKRIASYAFPGALMHVEYDSEGFALCTPAEDSRIACRIIRRFRLRGDVVVLSFDTSASLWAAYGIHRSSSPGVWVCGSMAAPVVPRRTHQRRPLRNLNRHQEVGSASHDVYTRLASAGSIMFWRRNLVNYHQTVDGGGGDCVVEVNRSLVAWR